VDVSLKDKTRRFDIFDEIKMKAFTFHPPPCPFIMDAWRGSSTQLNFFLL
jgi:hypothetical protein